MYLYAYFFTGENMTKDEALKLALKALERVNAIESGMVTTNRHHYQAKEDTTKAITAIKEALAQPAVTESHKRPSRSDIKPLTDEEIRKANHHMVDGAYDYSFKQGVKWAEYKHGIKGEA